MPIACSIAMKRCSITRTFGLVLAYSTSGWRTPAATSSFSLTNRSIDAWPPPVEARTISAFLMVRVR